MNALTVIVATLPDQRSHLPESFHILLTVQRETLPQRGAHLEWNHIYPLPLAIQHVADYNFASQSKWQ